METVLKLLIPILMQIIQSILKPENIQKYADKLFDLLEAIVKDSETEWDDKTILPVLELFRTALNIQHNDD